MSSSWQAWSSRSTVPAHVTDPLLNGRRRVDLRTGDRVDEEQLLLDADRERVGPTRRRGRSEPPTAAAVAEAAEEQEEHDDDEQDGEHGVRLRSRMVLAAVPARPIAQATVWGSPPGMRIGCFLSSEEFGPRRARRAGAARRGGRLPRPVDLRPLPPVERRAGPQPVRVVGDRRDLARSTNLPVTTAVTCPTVRHPSGGHRPGGGHAARCCSRAASGSASAAARPSTSTSSATAGPRPTCAWRCSRRPSRSSARSGRAASSSHHGRHYTVENARIYDLPEPPPPILVSGFGPKAIRAGRAHRRRLLHHVARQGGDRPLPLGGRQGSRARRDQGLLHGRRGRRPVPPRTGCGPTRRCPGELAQVLPTPAHFEQACELVTPDMLVTPVGPDLDAARGIPAPVPRRRRRRALRAADRARPGRVLRYLGTRDPATLRLT